MPNHHNSKQILNKFILKHLRPKKSFELFLGHFLSFFIGQRCFRMNLLRIWVAFGLKAGLG